MKKSILLVISFGAALAMLSCNKKFHTGTYSYSVLNAYYESFRLSSDSNFQYIFRSGWNNSNSNGTWSKHGKEIILNSQYQRNNLPISVIAMHKENTEEYIFKFMKYYSQNDNSNIWQILIFNNKDSFKIKDSIMKIKYLGELTSFKVQIVTTEYSNDSIGMNNLFTENYMVKSRNENEFTLDYPFEWSMSYYRDFDNEELILKNKSMYWTFKRQWYKWKP